MKYNELVSVVMPVHNGERFLREAIESVLNQTYKNFEFLIIENCSTDSSVEIIKSYNDERIRLIIEDNCGIPNGYNRGFKEAKGKYVIIHDQDDISFPNRIEAQLSYIIEKKLDLCGSSFLIINDKNEKVKYVHPPITKKEIFNKILFDFSAVFNPSLILKKVVLEELNYFDVNLQVGSDYDFLLRSLENYKLGNNPKILLKYRVHKSSTSKKNSNLWKDDLAISLKYFKKYKTQYNDKEFVLSKIFYFYGLNLKSSLLNIKSILKNGIVKEKIKYLSYTTVLVIPIYLLRKTNMFFDKGFNNFLNLIFNKNT